MRRDVRVVLAARGVAAPKLTPLDRYPSYEATHSQIVLLRLFGGR